MISMNGALIYESVCMNCTLYPNQEIISEQAKRALATVLCVWCVLSQKKTILSLIASGAD